jgi:hypothetical protein
MAKYHKIPGPQYRADGYGTEYLGYQYCWDIEDYGDCRKIWHMFEAPNGEKYSIMSSDLSPYRHPDTEEFEEIVRDHLLTQFVTGG